VQQIPVGKVPRKASKVIPDKDYTHQPGFGLLRLRSVQAAQPSVVERIRWRSLSARDNQNQGYIYYWESPNASK
jgi:hypothetical protein